MPAEVFGPNFPFLPRDEILSFEEIRVAAKVFSQLGVSKVRLTGGEPLLRRNLATLVRMLSKIEGIEDLALTTNGALLDKAAKDLAEAGLGRVTVSLDAMEESVFREMGGKGSSLEKVKRGIEASLEAGLGVKLNMVVQKEKNVAQVLPVARYGKSLGTPTRFIEYMDVGNHNGWKLGDVFTSMEILDVLSSEFSFEPVKPSYRGEVARRYREKDTGWEIGLISSVSQPFCGDCGRVRLTADGKLFGCLFSSTGLNVKNVLRSAEGEASLRKFFAAFWESRKDRYSENRLLEQTTDAKVEMSYVGG